MRRLISAIMAAGALMLAANGGVAQSTYPQRVVTMVVPWPPGGAVDVIARLVGQGLRESLGQAVIAENRPGAAGNIGAASASRAEPDGHTLMLTSAAISVSAATHPNPGFNLFADFRPITITAETPFVLVVNPSIPAKTVEEFINYARANPGRLNFGSSAKGTVLHLAGELFKQQAGIDFVDVPFTAGVQGVLELVAGRIDFMIEVISNVKPHIDEGKIRLLGVATAARLPEYPNAPTLSESGLTGYQASTWFGLFAPKRTPDQIVERLAAETVAVLKTPDATARLASIGIVPIANTPEEAARFIREDVDKWAEVARKAGLKQ